MNSLGIYDVSCTTVLKLVPSPLFSLSSLRLFFWPFPPLSLFLASSPSFFSSFPLLPRWSHSPSASTSLCWCSSIQRVGATRVPSSCRSSSGYSTLVRFSICPRGDPSSGEAFSNIWKSNDHVSKSSHSVLVPYSLDITLPSIISPPLTICINLLQRYIYLQVSPPSAIHGKFYKNGRSLRLRWTRGMLELTIPPYIISQLVLYFELKSTRAHHITLIHLTLRVQLSSRLII